MSFIETVQRAGQLLQQQGRISLRALKLEFELSDDQAEALVDELVDVQQVAAFDGKVLCWIAPAGEEGDGAAAIHRADARRDPSPARAPRDYTPKHLADRILQSRSALEGERKQVTVLFADVARSMELAEQVDPEVWHRILDRLFEILTDGVHRFEGTVNQYTGDGIMALFGAPIAHEDHAQRAAYAGLHLSEALRPFAREVKREHGLTLSTRTGLHSGDVIVGKIGDDLRMDYTAQGHTVGLAQRMEALASPDTIYLSGATAALLHGYFELDDLGPFQVKGAADPVQVFQLLRTGAHRTRFDRARARGLTRFVGRDADVRALEDALAQARAGNGQVVGIVAEAGTGKSRLCFEFVERCRQAGLSVNEGQALAHGRNVPLLPVLQAFRAYYGIDESDDPRTVREKIAGRMVLLDAAFQDDLPLLFDFFGAPDPERPAPAMDADARQRRLFQILRRTTRLGGGEGRAAVTLLEDLHWFDAASGEFLAEWVEAVAGTHTLLILNFRPEYQPAWIGRSYYRQLPLAPLGAEAIRELLEDLLGSDPSTRGLAERIHARTGGNPFFAEEVAQSLIESASLVGERGRYRLVTAVDELAIPDSVQSILASRIDRLPEREKQVLQAAAVIGHEFPEPVLREVASLPERDLAAALAALARSEFVREVELFPVAEYAFKHPLTQEVALGSQLSERRRRVHRAVAAALERFHAERLDEKAALLAHHLEEAGDAAAAAAWHARAADWTNRTDFTQGNWHWRRVVALTADAPASPERDRLRVAAISAVFATGWRLGLRADELAPLFDEARELLRAAADREREVVLLGNWAAFNGNCGDAQRYHELSEEGCALLDGSVAAETHAAAHSFAAYSDYSLGRFAQALDHTLEIIRFAEGDHQMGLASVGFSVWANGVHFRAQVLQNMGRFVEAEAALAKAEEVVRAQPRSEVTGWTEGDRARGAWLAGRISPHQALDLRPAALETLDYTRRIGSDFAQAAALYYTCLAHGIAGDWERAVETGREVLALASSKGVLLMEVGYLQAWLAWALRGAGKPADACEAATEGAELCEARGLAFQEALCRLERAGALRESLGAEAADRIERDLERVAVLVEQTGGRSILPRCIEERARLAALRGESSRPGLEEALAIYREIGADGHARRLAGEVGA